MIEVRRFEPEDLPALWALAALPDAGITEDPTVPVPLPPRRVAPTGPADLVRPETVTRAGGVLFVATDDGHLVGAGGLRPVHGRPHLGRVIRLRAHPAVRRRGVGRALMVALEDAARRQGLTDLLLDVGDHQPEALAFYQALGWSETWRESDPEGHWQTVWHHRSLTRDHLPVEVRPCAGETEVAAAERAMPSRTEVHQQRWTAQEAGEATYLLAWSHGEVVGHVLLRHTSPYDEAVAALGGHPEVGALAVSRAAQRRGVGTALTGAAAGLAQERGAALVGLVVEPDDPAAVSLCRRLGWRLRTEVPPIGDAGYWTLTLPG